MIFDYFCTIVRFCEKAQSWFVNLKEPKVKGDYVGEDHVTEYLKRLDEKFENEYPKEDKWYSVDYLSKIVLTDEEDAIDIEVTSKLNGKIFDTEYGFDQKAKLSYTVEIKGQVPATIDKEEKSDISIVANQVKHVPQEFINARGNNVTDECAEYLLPLIAGEASPRFENGIPQYLIIE